MRLQVCQALLLDSFVKLSESISLWPHDILSIPMHVKNK
jgi:hypothetical protein